MKPSSPCECFEKQQGKDVSHQLISLFDMFEKTNIQEYYIDSIGMKTTKEISSLKDGCMWQPRSRQVVGQEAERGEGWPDEATSSS